MLFMMKIVKYLLKAVLVYYYKTMKIFNEN